MDTLVNILAKADTAQYTFDGYSVYVSETVQSDKSGYDLAICKGAMPPHVYKIFASLDALELYLDNSLGYTNGDSTWQVCNDE